MEFIACSAVIGAFLGLFRGRVVLVLFASAFTAIVVMACGLLLGHHLGVSLLTGLASVAAVQVSYASLSISLQLFSSQNFPSEVQAAIGQQLRAEFEVPRNLPPAMVRLVGQLRAA
jgi:hypothetical protein